MSHYQPSSHFAKVVDNIEETCIAICLGLMTLITFANVIARYVFNDNILWALEATVYLFAWLVLMGASYGVKHHNHIGVDVIVNLVSPPVRRILGMIAVGCCLAFAIFLLVGSWNYWWPFASSRAWMETEDVPIPDFLRFLEPWLNEGEAYEKLPRFIPYAALPLGMALLTFRFAQLAWQVATGKIDKIIAAHEVEEELEQAMDEEEKYRKDHDGRDL